LALEYLASRNIIHRDLKPESVTLDVQGYPRVINFEVAKVLDGSCRALTMIGTPHYMAPEVLRGRDCGYGTAVDIWALGVMMFEFVVGYLPFADSLDDPTDVCTVVLREQVSFPIRFKDVLGKDLIEGMLNKKPSNRLGAAGYDDLKSNLYFSTRQVAGSSLFDKLLRRELQAPVVGE